MLVINGQLIVCRCISKDGVANFHICEAPIKAEWHTPFKSKILHVVIRVMSFSGKTGLFHQDNAKPASACFTKAWPGLI